jgi:hypothetical protein
LKTESMRLSSRLKKLSALAPIRPEGLALFIRFDNFKGQHFNGGFTVGAKIWARETPSTIYRYLKFREGRMVRNIYLGSVRRKNAADSDH